MGGGGGGGLFGGASQMLFGDGGAEAAGKAAMAQQGAARSALKEYRNYINPATTAGLLQLDKDIASQERNIARQEQLIANIDPAIIEASQQALKLLKGERSSTLAPVEQQRAQQRQTLLNTLREQLGPGAEMSTAGMQALTRFDSETNQLMAGQQQQALAGLGGLAGQFTSMRPNMLREISGRSAFGQAKTGLEFDRAQGIWNARQPLFQTAGAQYTGDVLKGQQSAALGQAVIGGLAQGLGGSFLGG